MDNNQPFTFFTERRLVALTGMRAVNLSELLAGIQQVPGSCIFYHTHQQYLSQHYQKPLFYNDFAAWVAEALQQQRLAEQLAAIDLLAFTTIRDLRQAIIETVERGIAEARGPARHCPAGDEFHFCRSKSFIFPTGLVAQTVPEFFERLPEASNISVYFHFFEARLRLGRPTNDFSHWLQTRGEHDMANAINRLDPYVRTLDELRNDIVAVGRRYLRLGARA